MFATFLITFREVIEASVIVTLILGVLHKTKQTSLLRPVWLAVALAVTVCILLLLLATIAGVQVQSFYEEYEAYLEGFLMIVSTIFITWTVFYLHKYLSHAQRQLTAKITAAITASEQRGLFALVFASVFREGIEILIFLSTIILTSSPQNIYLGYFSGIIAGILVSWLLYRSTQKLDFSRAVKIINILLVVVSAGLLSRGIHEFTEVGYLPDIGNMALSFIPSKTTIIGSFIKSIFGLTNSINIIQIFAYLGYLFFMIRYLRKSPSSLKT